MFRIAPILLFLGFLTPFIAFAATPPAYVVNEVKVDIVAESAVKARNEAFAAAQSKAFKMLTERFLSAEEAAALVPPDANVIAGMVADFEITSEQLSKRRYLGNYIFRFKPAAVNRYFGHGPVQAVDLGTPTQARLIVLPTFTQNGKTVLWDSAQNPWLQAWQAQDGKDYPFIVVPKSDISDRMDVRSVDPEKITTTSYKRIKARYSVQDVVILAAVFDQSAKDILKINVYRTDAGKAQLVQILNVPRGNATKLGELLAATVPYLQKYLAGQWKNANADVAYDAAASPDANTSGTRYATAADYPDYRPENNNDEGGQSNISAAPVSAVSSSKPGSVRASVTFRTMSEWLTVRRGLNNVPELQALRLIALSTNKADMQLDYSDWSGLVKTLNSRGLILQPAGPGLYIISRTANAG